MESAIRQIITKAVTEIEEESRAREAPLSGNEFLGALFAKLFPESTANVVVPMAEPEVEQLTKAMETLAVAEKKKPGPKPRAKKAEAEAAPTTPEAPKPEAEAPPAPKKPRAKKEKAPVNLDKLTPTQTKQLKKLAEEVKVEVDKKDMLAYVNAMTAEDYNAHTLDEHMRAFVKSRTGGAPAPEPEAEKELDCVEVEFEGQTYYVCPEDKRVYKEEGGGHVFVGYVGMAAFEKMEIPEDA